MKNITMGCTYTHQAHPQISPSQAPLVWIALLMIFCLISPQVLAAPTQYNTPAEPSPLAATSRLVDITAAGDRLIAIGIYGHIIYSDDQAGSWQQAQSPVSSTLTAIYFATPQIGWVVGHGSLVLKTEDGGQSWHKQLDAAQAAQLMLDDATAKLAAYNPSPDADSNHEEALQLYLEAAEIAQEDGYARPFLDIYFIDDQRGLVVGAYGHIFATEDGGNSWQPRQLSINNPDSLHFNAITGANGSLFIAGEYGSLFRSDDLGNSWQALDLPYDGTLFGIQTHGGGLYTYGLRGNLFHSTDAGDSWQQVETSVPYSLFGSVSVDDQLLLIGANGTLLFGNADAGLQQIHQQNKAPYSAAVATHNQLLLVGPAGIEARTLPLQVVEVQ